VTLTSRTQGNVLTAIADNEGRFVFPIVRPDGYTMRVSMQGFKTLERTNVVVNANDKFSAGVVTLAVGDISEEVSVLARVSELQTTSGERSFTLESEALKNIANNGRQVFTFATLVPGVVSNLNNDAAPGQASDLSVNGQRANSNSVAMVSSCWLSEAIAGTTKQSKSWWLPRYMCICRNSSSRSLRSFQPHTS
jgi:hypothetical protein